MNLFKDEIFNLVDLGYQIKEEDRVKAKSRTYFTKLVKEKFKLKNDEGGNEPIPYEKPIRIINEQGGLLWIRTGIKRRSVSSYLDVALVWHFYILLQIPDP